MSKPPKVKHPLIPVDAEGKCPAGYMVPRDGKCYYWDKTGCGDSEPIIKPEKTTVAKGETINIGYTYVPDTDIINGWFDGDSAWNSPTWNVAGQAIAGNPSTVTFMKETPGTYEVQLGVNTKMKSCRGPINTSAIITVVDGAPAPPPPAPSHADCGDSYVHIQPELLRVAPGQTMTIKADIHIDNTVEFFRPDKGWSKTEWFINSVKVGDQATLSFKQDSPGTYAVSIIVTTNMRNCRQLKSSIPIEVTSTPGPKPSPNPIPSNGTCPSGYTLSKDWQSCIPVAISGNTGDYDPSFNVYSGGIIGPEGGEDAPASETVSDKSPLLLVAAGLGVVGIGFILYNNRKR